MDLDSHVNQIVQGIVADITTKVQSQVADIINQKVTEVVNAIDCTPLLIEKLSQKIDEKLNHLPIDTKSVENELTNRLNVAAQVATENVQTQAAIAINDIISNKINAMDFRGEYQKTILSSIQNNYVTFPSKSIPVDALDLSELVITGENIHGGIITNFGSTGIQDLASDCQLTITDDVTVVENNLLTQNLTVKGSTTIEGDLNVTGSIPESSPMFIKFVNAATNNLRTSLDRAMFDGYANTVLEKLREEGITLDKITVNGQDVLNGSMLGNFITQSNLQTVGLLKELQVSGESFLGQTLYSNQKRVGINTLEPSNVLSIWDQEVELGFGKLENNTAFVAAPRNQKLVLSSNSKNNVTLETDGSTTVKQLNIGDISITAGTSAPAGSMPKGTIVFNANPSLGGPLGWVSLGDARWANFGIID